MKVNENGTLLKVKCLILLNIFSVFPTHVGMFPENDGFAIESSSLPHACGDVPFRHCVLFRLSLSSPRMWGCSFPYSGHWGGYPVFPTHVGMFLVIVSHGFLATSLPHACGDVPYVQFVMTGKIESSPRMWGCSC